MAEDAKPTDKPDARPLPPIAAKARDLEALRNAVVDAANVGAGLWFSYLFVLLYLMIAVGSVTHRNLLLETPVRLPFLNVDLPLLGFFVLGPALFLIVHAYVLLHFVLLAGKVGVFRAELEAQIADPGIRGRLRQQLPSNIFVQFLAGPREVRSGLVGAMMRLIAQISLVAGPLALLVFFLVQFLPYHHDAIAWWQRMAVVIDLALLWALWPSVARGQTASITRSDFQRPKVAGAAIASLVPVLFVFTIATFPGEWLHRNPVAAPVRWLSLHQLLFAGDVDLVTRKPTSLWSNRLVLPGVDMLEPGKFDSDAKIAAVSETFSLRDRQLKGAVLLGARLRKVDFTAANLQGAVFDDADLREANFGCAASRMKVDNVSAEEKKFLDSASRCTQLQRASFDRARMQGAKLDEAFLEAASFADARLQGASLDGARLHGAMLEGAQLQAASLDGAWLHGAWLRRAQLQGASLHGARLQGAWLQQAQLQGASLKVALLQGATLDEAQLQGALLETALLGGASLDGAQLQGASLRRAFLLGASIGNRAQLQGADLDGAELKGALVNETLLWRTDVRAANREGVVVINPEVEAKYRGLDCDEPDDGPCEWSDGAFAALKRLIETTVPDGAYRAQALDRIAILAPGAQPDWQASVAGIWVKLAGSPPPRNIHEQELARQVRLAACIATDITIHALRAMVTRIKSSVEDPRIKAELAAVLLDAKQCPAMQMLEESDKSLLRGMQGSIK